MPVPFKLSDADTDKASLTSGLESIPRGQEIRADTEPKVTNRAAQQSTDDPPIRQYTDVSQEIGQNHTRVIRHFTDGSKPITFDDLGTYRKTPALMYSDDLLKNDSGESDLISPEAQYLLHLSGETRPANGIDKSGQSDPSHQGIFTIQERKDLSASHFEAGKLLFDHADDGYDELAASRTLDAGLKIREELAAEDPGNGNLQRDIADGHDRVGDMKLHSFQPRALKAFEAGLKIRKTLVEKDPGNSLWQSDLAGSHDRIGDMLLAIGDREGSLEAFEAGFKIREALVEKDPGNSLWQSDLAGSHDRIGDVQLVMGDRAGALKAFEAGFKIRETLVEKDPGNSIWQRDLAGSRDRIINELFEPSLDKLADTTLRQLIDKEAVMPGDLYESAFFTGKTRETILVNNNPEIEHLIDQLLEHRGLEFRHLTNGAYVSFEDGRVNVPPENNFMDTRYTSATQGYYKTVFHELVHWTGEEPRLDRFIPENNMEDHPAFAREELVAELGAVMLMKQFNIAPKNLKQSAVYFQHWLGRCGQSSNQLTDKERNEALNSARKEAVKAVEWLLSNR